MGVVKIKTKALVIMENYLLLDEDGEVRDAPPLPEDGLMNPPAPPPLPQEDATTTAEPPVNDSLVEFILNRDANESVTEVKDAAEESKDGDDDKLLLSSKGVVEGTPLLKSASPYDKLPGGEKWSVGVSDVINFENLPDSVGKYEKMKVLIKKVQTKVKQIHGE